MVAEQARHQLAVKVRALLGEAEGDTLMAMLPPVGWADVATKQDLTHLGEVLRAELAALRSELRGEIAALRNEFRGEVAQLRGEMAEMKGELRGEIGQAIAKQTRTFIAWNGAMLLTLATLAYGDRLLA